MADQSSNALDITTALVTMSMTHAIKTGDQPLCIAMSCLLEERASLALFADQQRRVADAYKHLCVLERQAQGQEAASVGVVTNGKQVMIFHNKSGPYKGTSYTVAGVPCDRHEALLAMAEGIV